MKGWSLSILCKQSQLLALIKISCYTCWLPSKPIRCQWHVNEHEMSKKAKFNLLQVAPSQYCTKRRAQSGLSHQYPLLCPFPSNKSINVNKSRWWMEPQHKAWFIFHVLNSRENASCAPFFLFKWTTLGYSAKFNYFHLDAALTFLHLK